MFIQASLCVAARKPPRLTFTPRGGEVLSPSTPIRCRRDSGAARRVEPNPQISGFRVRGCRIAAERRWSNWRGVRRVAPNPSFQRYQPACKPGFVGHRPLARTIRDGHSSGTMFAHGLEQPTRTASLTSPCGVIAFANSPRCRPYSVLLPVWFAMPFPLPDPRCALTAPFHPYCPSPSASERRRRFVLCGTVPGVAPAGRYPAPYVDGARTFLSRSLSAVAGAAVRPTDAHRHGG